MSVTLRLIFIVALCALARFESALGSEPSSGRRSTSQSEGNFKSACGTSEQVSRRGGECLVPIFELLEGRFSSPTGDLDVQRACNRFNTTARCVRQITKDCLNGLHKTAVGAVATAMRRFYVNECKSVSSRQPYFEPLKCAIKNGQAVKRLYEKQTGIMQGIRDLPIPPEEKIIKMCCVLNNVDDEVAKIYNINCPESTPTIIKLIHAVTDDARNTLCVNPKCKGALDRVKNTKYKPPQNFIEPVQQIVFQINV